MMSGLRKPHAKTRNGCGRCKQRRVRCDLRPPICSNCERRRESCDYSALHVGFHEQLSKDPSISGQDTYGELSIFRTSVNFELAIHFDALTSSTFDLPETPLVWRKKLVKQADTQLYLRQSSLALAALHVMHSRPTQKDPHLYHRAHAYQNEACALFRSSVKEVNSENGLSILAFCVITVIFQFSTSLLGRADPNAKHQMDIFSPLSALRSGALLLGSCRDVTIHHESLSGALGRLGADVWRFPSSIGEQNQAALEALEGTVLRVQRVGDSTPATSHAFLVLRGLFTMFPSPPKGWFHVLYWPSMVREDYFDELQRVNPVAIIAFIYWCAYLNNPMHQWYLEKWPRTAALHMLTKLDPQWHDVLAWPRKRLGLSSASVDQQVGFTDESAAMNCNPDDTSEEEAHLLLDFV